MVVQALFEVKRVVEGDLEPLQLLFDLPEIKVCVHYVERKFYRELGVLVLCSLSLLDQLSKFFGVLILQDGDLLLLLF